MYLARLFSDNVCIQILNVSIASGVILNLFNSFSFNISYKGRYDLSTESFRKPNLVTKEYKFVYLHNDGQQQTVCELVECSGELNRKPGEQVKKNMIINETQ